MKDNLEVWLMKELILHLKKAFAYLVARVKWSRSEWKTSTWRVLSEQLQEDAEAMRDASPSGIGMYASSLALVVEYLLEYRAGREIRELHAHTAENLRCFNSLQAAMKEMCPTCYSQSEEAVIKDALEAIQAELLKLDCYRPA